MKELITKETAYAEYHATAQALHAEKAWLRYLYQRGEQLAIDARKAPIEKRQAAIDACKACKADRDEQIERIKVVQKKKDKLFAIWNA